MPFEVPEGWEWCQVSDIFELNPKNDIPDDTQSGFIPMACVDDGFGYSHTFETRVWKEIRKGYSHFQNGDIGIAKISPCFENRKSTIFYGLPNGIGAGTTELTVLRGHCVNTEFYLYLFQSEWYIFEGTKEFKGVVGQQRVNKEIFTTLLIPLPPIEEQNRIVTEIKKWFALIDTLESAKEDLQMSIAQAKSKILDLAIHGKLVPQDTNDEPAIELLKRINPKFTPCDNAHYENNTIEIPKNWEWAKLSDIAVSELGKTLDKGKNSGTPHNYLCAFNVKWCSFDFSVIKKILLEDEELERYKVRKGDLLICEGGDVGRAAIWESDQDIYYQNALHRVRFKNEINQYFYLYVLQYYKSLGMIDDVSGGVTIKHFTQNSMKKLSFPLPPIKEQYRIVSAINQYNTILDDISANL